MVTTESSIEICIIQPPLRQDDECPLHATDAVIDLMKEAHQGNTKSIDLFVLPELCPVGYTEDTFSKYLPCTKETQTMYSTIHTKFQTVARQLKCHICYGTIGWKIKKKKISTQVVNGDQQTRREEQPQDDDERENYDYEYFIRQVVINSQGDEIATYDKIHLCDYGDCSETRFFTSGNELSSFRITTKAGDTFRFGIIICADMRYPLLSQLYTRDHNIDVLLQPSCFIRDISFRTWTSFRETRAVENGIYFVACNYAGKDFGSSSIVPPWIDEQHEPIVYGNDIGYLIGTIHRNILNHARTQLPFHRHVMNSPDSKTSSSCCDWK